MASPKPNNWSGYLADDAAETPPAATIPAGNNWAGYLSEEAPTAEEPGLLSRANAYLTGLVAPINARIGQALAPGQVGADPATMPESAAAMRPTGAPSAPVDAAATFERLGALRKKLLAEGKRPESDAEYVGLLRDQAAGVAQNDRAAATFLAPAVPGAGIAGRVAAVAERAPNLLQLAPAETRAITNPLPIAPMEAPDALTSAMLDRLNQAGIRPSRPSAFPDNQLSVRVEPTIAAEPALPVAQPQATVRLIGPRAAPVEPSIPAPAETASGNRMPVQPAEAPVNPVLHPEESGPAHSEFNPAGEAAPATGPHSPTTPAEMAAVPTALPPLRLPLTTQKAYDARADEIIRHFAKGGRLDGDIADIIPGSPSTLAQAHGNAGLATLERGMRNVAPNDFAAYDEAAKAAQKGLLARIVGTPEALEAAKAERSAQTSALREKAFAEGVPTDVSETVGLIDKELAGPTGKRPLVRGPLQSIRDEFFQTDPATGKLTAALEDDPARLYGLRQGITDRLGPLAKGTSADARAASAVLQPILQSLDAAIEKGAPGYKAYMKEFAAKSGPIDTMEYFQGRNLTDTAGNPSLGSIDKAIKDIRKAGITSGAKKADSVSEAHMEALEKLRDDMLAKKNSLKGKALGSDTAQNLATNTTMAALTNPLAALAGKAGGALFGGLGGYIGSEAASSAVSAAARRAEAGVRAAVIDRLLNREGKGVRALAPKGKPSPFPVRGE